MNYKHSIVGSAVAFIIATSCCWLPALIIGLGGATGMLAFANGLEQLSGVFTTVGIIALIYGVHLYNRRKTGLANVELQLSSIITCPECKHQQEETMPTDACQYFYECSNCKAVLKPKSGDCCVYCSYGTVACPPIQQDLNCC